MNNYVITRTLKRFFIIIICFTAIINKSYSKADSTLVTGTVTATDGSPVVGAMIYVQGFSSSFSDENGNFTLHVPSSSSTIECNAKGYEYMQIPVKGKSEIAITLYKKGYRSQYNLMDLPFSKVPQNNTVFAASIVDGQDACKNPAESFDLYLQGKVAGLNVTAHSGLPGAGASLLLRGYNSFLLNSQPLIIIDGMMFEYSGLGTPIIYNSFQNLLTAIDSKDIESVTVLKDATSVYGSKGSNGVIIIRTKHTTDATTKITFNSYAGINMAPKTYPLMDGSAYKTYLAEMLQSAGYSTTSISKSEIFNTDTSASYKNFYNNNTNWQDEVIQNSISQNYYLGVSGGDDVAKYNLSIGYLNSGGIIRNTNLSRFNTRFNSDIYFSQRFLVNVNLGFAVITRNIFDDGVSPYSPLTLSTIKAPFSAPYKISKEGEVSTEYMPADFYSNPVALMNLSDFMNKNNSFIFSVNFNYTINPYLKLHSLVGINYSKFIDDVFIPENGIVPIKTYTTIERTSIKRTNRFNSVYNETRLNFNKIFGYAHEVNANLGVRYLNNNLRENWSAAYNSANDYNRALNFGTLELAKTGGSLGKSNWISLFAQADYNYLKKYFISVVFETDGSSKFGDEANGINLLNNKFGVFPSIGAAWLVSSEKFMSGVSVINLLKLRLSYGITGNDGLGNYWKYRIYNEDNLYGQRTIVAGNPYNPALQWETSKKMNFGLDMAMLNNRINTNIDFYKNTIKDLVYSVSLPSYAGTGYYMMNVGSIENSGVEVNLNARVLNRTIKWDVGLTLAKNNNKIIEIYNDKAISTSLNGELLHAEGQPMGQFFGFVTEKTADNKVKVFATQQEAQQSGLFIMNENGTKSYFQAGDIQFVDKNGDNEINDADKEVIGNANPKLTGGLSTALSYKGLKLSALFTYSYGNDIYNAQRAMLESMSDYKNQTPAALKRWRSEGQITDMPKAVYGDPMGNARFSDRWIEDGSYLKLKMLTLSYTIETKNDVKRDITIFATGTNLLTFTKYMGFDPEFSQSGYAFFQGIDHGLTPVYKSVIIGLNLGL